MTDSLSPSRKEALLDQHISDSNKNTTSTPSTLSAAAVTTTNAAAAAIRTRLGGGGCGDDNDKDDKDTTRRGGDKGGDKKVYDPPMVGGDTHLTSTATTSKSKLRPLEIMDGLTVGTERQSNKVPIHQSSREHLNPDGSGGPPEEAPENGGGGSSDGTTRGILQVLWQDYLIGKWINVLLFCIPLAWWSYAAGWSSSTIFWLNFFAMVPLASLLGDFTEEVAAHTNQVIGGLINATFGNAVEVVVAIQALLANEIRVVQASMIGSIFSNLLLVLGCCFFFGGLKHKEQTFNSTAATLNMSLLALSSIALVLPTPFAQYYDIEDERVLDISRIAAVFLMVMYIQLMFFQLKTHAFLFTDGDQDDEEETKLPFGVAIGGLTVLTAIIAKLSDFLVDSIDGFTEESGVSRTFVGLIIIPIVGNAVEHVAAVTVAMKDKMDLAMGIAIGSCTQISLFVVPVTVLVGWAGNKDMTLNFPEFEIILFIMSVVIVSIALSSHKSNWLEGSLLITTYLMIAVGFWFEKVEDF